MAVSAVDSLLDALRQNQLLRPNQLAELEREAATRFSDPRALGQYVLKQGWLTAFQVNQLFRGGELYLGPYLLLERLGEGYGGQVFKARHQRMNRVVALKAIRQELLAKEELIQRFYAEVQATSQLSHPNVVHAFDAGPMGPTHCMVREFVEGIDLGRLVQQSGPLPVREACDAIHQAALGLQHAHQYGLLHGAIKPSKLLETQAPVTGVEHEAPTTIKLLDIGLAFLYGSADGDSLNSQMRQHVRKSIDYVAPEQLETNYPVDIRSDIFSLGCTFYFLLAGLSPAQRKAKPLTALRPEVPPELSSILAKMTAPTPGDRYASPVEAAAALEPFTRPGPETLFALPEQQPPADTDPPSSSKSLARQLRERSQWRTLIGASAGLLVAVLFLFIALGGFSGGSGNPRPNTETKPYTPPHWLDGSRIPIEEREKAGNIYGLAAVVRHGAKPVRCLALNARSQLLATGGDDHEVRLWDWKTGKPAGLFFKHTKPVLSLDASPNGKLVASGGRDRRIRLWDPGSCTEKKAIALGTEWAQGATFLDGGKTVACRGHNSQVWIFDTAGKRIGTLTNENKKVTAVAFNANGKLAALGSDDKNIRLYETTGKSGKLLRKMPGHAAVVHSVCFSPDGTTLASGSSDATVKLWNPATGGIRSTFNKHQKPVVQVAFTPNGQAVLSATAEGRIMLWHPGVHKVFQVWNTPGPIYDLAVSPDGKYFLVASHTGAVYIIHLPKT